MALFLPLFVDLSGGLDFSGLGRSLDIFRPIIFGLSVYHLFLFFLGMAAGSVILKWFIEVGWD